MKTASVILCLALFSSTGAAEDVLASAQTTPAIAAPTQEAEGVKVVRFEFATGVDAREPVGTASEFQAGTRVYAFLELQNSGDARELTVRFTREGEPASKGVALWVPKAKRYRTFAFRTHTKKPGRYRCVVTTADGSVLADKTFDVVREAPEH